MAPDEDAGPQFDPTLVHKNGGPGASDAPGTPFSSVDAPLTPLASWFSMTEGVMSPPTVLGAFKDANPLRHAGRLHGDHRRQHRRRLG